MTIGRRPAALALLGLAATLLGGPLATPAPPGIRVDQVGYRPPDVKLALVAGAPTTFAVREAASGRIVLEGRAGAPAPSDPASGDRVAILDFNPVREPGQYVVTAPGVAASPSFAVGETVYARLLAAVLRVFTYHRCGAPMQRSSPTLVSRCSGLHPFAGRAFGTVNHRGQTWTGFRTSDARTHAAKTTID